MNRLLRVLAGAALAAGASGGIAVGGTVPAFAGGGCHSATPTDGTGTTVAIRDACFAPNVLHVRPGDTVTWTNQEEVPHTVTGTAGSFGTYDGFNIGHRVGYQFTKNGVYPYFCVLHPGMAGAVVVGDGSGPGPAQRTAVMAATPAPATTPVAVTPVTARATDGLLPWGLLGLIGLAFGALAGRVTRRRIEG